MPNQSEMTVFSHWGKNVQVKKRINIITEKKSVLLNDK